MSLPALHHAAVSTTAASVSASATTTPDAGAVPPTLGVPLFLLGFMAGAFAMGFLALVMHRRLAEELTRDQARRLSAARHKAYGQGYQHRAALEFAAREEGA